jgi:hypothetical protein
MEAVENAAQTAGRHLLVLDTLSGSDAERLYTRMGWSRVAEIPGYAALPNGQFAATTIFYKELASTPRTQVAENTKPGNA